MGGTLEALHRLQEIETQLVAIRQGISSKERRLEQHQRRAKMAQERFNENQQTARARQIQLDQLTLDVAAREDAIAKQREALGKAKTNKAYADILAVMNTSKADNSKLESGILQLMEDIQAFENTGTTIEAEKAEFLTQAVAAEAKLGEYKEERREERERLETSRDECAKSIPPTALAVFMRVAGHHDGEAMARVVTLHAKRQEFACAGCNMKVTLQAVNALYTSDDLQLCSNCGRLMYLEKTHAR